MASHWKERRPLGEYLEEAGVAGLEGIDTRALTRRLRDSGAMGGVLTTGDEPVEVLAERARREGRMEGRDLASQVTCAAPWDFSVEGDRRIGVYDFGVKTNILRCLAERGARVRVFPAGAPVDEVLAWNPDGVLLSNGPGDPQAVEVAQESTRRLIEEVPVFGICLGLQFLGLAFGGRTFKLKFGHHAANHPVRDHATGKIEITSQNHGFAVDPESLDPARVEITHSNLNDGTIEGLAHRDRPAFGVQYHPESAPGPHDSRYLFDRFLKSTRGR
jgi:carbamoyl-phosphate synthase small subunit